MTQYNNLLLINRVKKCQLKILCEPYAVIEGAITGSRAIGARRL